MIKRIYRKMSSVDWGHPDTWGPIMVIFIVLAFGVYAVLVTIVSPTSADEQRQRDKQAQLDEQHVIEQQTAYAEELAQKCKDQGGKPFNLDHTGKCFYEGVVVEDWYVP